MQNFRIALFALPLLLTQIWPSVANTIPRLAKPLNGRDDGVIKALLRIPVVSRSESDLISRQSGSCPPSSLPCSDGESCCPISTFCDPSGGTMGCCPNGQKCVGLSDECSTPGSFSCEGKNFCCPNGSTCGANSCDDSGSGSSPRPSFTLPTSSPFTRTSTATSERFTGVNFSTVPPTLTRPVFTSGTQNAQNTATGGGNSLGPFNGGEPNGAVDRTGANAAILILMGVAINFVVAL